MTMFATLELIQDESTRSAALNMAIDEALLEFVTAPTLRVYGWDHPALSFGYFGRFADVANEKRDLVRRWTGGGIVFHGDDLTYALIIPAGAEAFAESSAVIYERVHSALVNALIQVGHAAELSSAAAVDLSRRSQAKAEDRPELPADDGATARESADARDECFAKPVRADVLIGGRKIAGAAQRRSRRGLLQQGSIQQVTLPHDFVDRFATELAASPRERKIDPPTLQRALDIAAEKYATDAWLQRR
jgi:lipoate-protein ligase A